MNLEMEEIIMMHKDEVEHEVEVETEVEPIDELDLSDSSDEISSDVEEEEEKVTATRQEPNGSFKNVSYEPSASKLVSNVPQKVGKLVPTILKRTRKILPTIQAAPLKFPEVIQEITKPFQLKVPAKIFVTNSTFLSTSQIIQANRLKHETKTAVNPILDNQIKSHKMVPGIVKKKNSENISKRGTVFLTTQVEPQSLNKNLHHINTEHNLVTSNVNTNFVFPSVKPKQRKVNGGILEFQTESNLRHLCTCSKSQCLKLYCRCFAGGKFCYKCNCINCFNTLDNEEQRNRAIKNCQFRNENAFKPKIRKVTKSGYISTEEHVKGCNCRQSACLKNYCECYEGNIACSDNCTCIGCRNLESSLEKKNSRYAMANESKNIQQANSTENVVKPLVSFITDEVIEATYQCLITLFKMVEASKYDEEAIECKIIEEFGWILNQIAIFQQNQK